MKNVIQMLSSEDISRLRIGLGGLKNERQDMVDFVLQKFKKDEIEKLQDVFFDATKKVDEFIKES